MDDEESSSECIMNAESHSPLTRQITQSDYVTVTEFRADDLSSDINNPVAIPHQRRSSYNLFPLDSNLHSLECNVSTPDEHNRTDASDSNTCPGTVSNMMDDEESSNERIMNAESHSPLITRQISSTQSGYVTATSILGVSTSLYGAAENNRPYDDDLETPSLTGGWRQSGESQSRELQLPGTAHDHPITRGDNQETRSCSPSLDIYGLELSLEFDAESIPITQGNRLEESGLVDIYKS